MIIIVVAVVAVNQLPPDCVPGCLLGFECYSPMLGFVAIKRMELFAVDGQIEKDCMECMGGDK